MSPWIDVEINGQSLRLLAGCGVFWPSRRVLFVADTHFGKDATFRRHRIPVPRGSTEGTLATISEMIAATRATQVVVLGDMFHAASSLAPDVNESLNQFFTGHAGLELAWIRGNHDARVPRLPAHWPIRELDVGTLWGGLALAHHPGPCPQHAALMLSGHIHPAVHVAVGGESLGTLPCFWTHRGCLVLPAVGEFTGTHRIAPSADDRVWFIAEGNVIEKKVRLAGTT